MASSPIRLVSDNPEPRPNRAQEVLGRGYQPVYVRDQRNVCPGCGNGAWWINDRGPGVRAECANEDCGVILPVESRDG